MRQVLLAMILVAAAGAAPAAEPIAPVPEPAARHEFLMLVKSVFRDRYVSPVRRDQQALAQELLRQGLRAGDTPAAQYVLLEESAQAAVRAGDVGAALQAVDEITRRFDVDPIEKKSEVLQAALATATDAAAAKPLADAFLALADAAARADNYDLACKAADAAQGLAKTAGDAALFAVAKTKADEMRAAKTEYDRVRTAMAKLAEDPTDLAANLLVGKFLAYVKGNWEGGPRFLAKGGDAQLRELAQKEIAKPQAANDRVALADRWRDLGEKEPRKVAKINLLGRARFWYKTALLDASDVERKVLEARLTAIESALRAADKNPWQPARTPMAGGAGGRPFEDRPDGPGILVGLNYTVGLYGAHVIVKSIQPVFLTPKGTTTGKVHGDPNGEFRQILARQGYAIGALAVGAGDRVNCFKVTFMRCRDHFLDQRDKYESEWIGSPEGRDAAVTLGGTGDLIVGLFGRRTADIEGFGLLEMGK